MIIFSVIKEQKITIQSSGGLSDAEIAQMVKDAEENASKDEEKKALVEARNKADSLIHSTEKSLKEYGDKISSTDKEEVENIIKDLRSIMDSENVGEINSKVESLTQASMKIGQHVYGNEQQPPSEDNASTNGGNDSNEDEKVVDAEYEEVNDEKDKGSK